MILESIVTTVSSDGIVNLAPMGPEVDEDFASQDPGTIRFLLKPFCSSQTYQNLIQTRCAVVHVTDDASLIARAAVDAVGDQELASLVRNLESTNWWPLRDCHRWFAVEIESINSDPQRSAMECRVVRHETVRPCFGFNRAKSAVIEAAILATRTHLIPSSELLEQLRRLRPLVDKTGGEVERHAFNFLEQAIDERIKKQ